jgi:hypothetical protein
MTSGRIIQVILRGDVACQRRKRLLVHLALSVPFLPDQYPKMTLQRLDDAWNNPAQHGLVIRGIGGEGKNSLVAVWTPQIAGRNSDGASTMIDGRLIWADHEPENERHQRSRRCDR